MLFFVTGITILFFLLQDVPFTLVIHKSHHTEIWKARDWRGEFKHDVTPGNEALDRYFKDLEKVCKIHRHAELPSNEIMSNVNIPVPNE